MRTGRRQRALDILGQLDPSAPDKVCSNLDSFSKEYVEIVLGLAFADVVARPALDLRTRELLTVAILAAMGTAPDQLAFHIKAAANIGVQRQEILEAILQVSVYAGVPAFINALTAARSAGLAAETGQEPPKS